MKKKIIILLTFLFAATLLSCGENDTSLESNKESLVGVWKHTKLTIYMEGEIFKVLNKSECEQKGTYTFFENGTMKRLEFKANDLGNCIESNIVYMFNGNWEINKDGVYQFIHINPSGNIETDTPQEITFPNNNKMLFKWYSNENLIIDNLGGIDEFERVY